MPSTKITMADGKPKRIDQVKVGDIVMSWDKDKMVPKKVTRTYKSVADKIVKVTSSGEPVWCTPEHPFLTSNRSWVNAEDLVPGDKIVHWSLSDRRKVFNPMFDPANHGIMSQEEKNKAATRLSTLWEDPEFREKNIERMSGLTNPMKDPATALKSWINRTTQVKSGLETKIEKICEGLPITFVGAGDLVIQHKVPDFVVDGQKKVIEVWADDSLWVKKSPRGKEWMEKRKALFEKEGYDTLFLPLVQSELKMSEHSKIREKVAEFIYNGKVVKSVEFVNEADGRGWARLFGSKTAERTVYNFEVEDTHTYIANGCVVHNCDTFFDDGTWMTFDEIEADIEKAIDEYFKDTVRPEYTKHNIQTRREERNNHPYQIPDWDYWVQVYDKTTMYKDMVLVITGGEPMLQKNLVPFLERMNRIFAYTQIESNGIVVQDIPKKTTLVVSPKCSEKNGVAVKYLKPNPKMLERADCLKFVMSAVNTSPYAEIPDWSLEWKNETGKEVFISPMNIYNDIPKASKNKRAMSNDINLEERSNIDEVISFWEPGLLDMGANQINHEYTAQYCIKTGCTFNMQQHLFASLA